MLWFKYYLNLNKEIWQIHKNNAILQQSNSGSVEGFPILQQPYALCPTKGFYIDYLVKLQTLLSVCLEFLDILEGSWAWTLMAIQGLFALLSCFVWCGWTSMLILTQVVLIHSSLPHCHFEELAGTWLNSEVAGTLPRMN